MRRRPNSDVFFTQPISRIIFRKEIRFSKIGQFIMYESIFLQHFYQNHKMFRSHLIYWFCNFTSLNQFIQSRFWLYRQSITGNMRNIKTQSRFDILLPFFITHSRNTINQIQRNIIEILTG